MALHRLAARSKLALSVVPERRAKQLQAHAAQVARLTPRARKAWEAWLEVRGQVRVLNPHATKSEDVRVVLETAAVQEGLRLLDVPERDRRWTWGRVLSLHEIAFHERSHASDSTCFQHGVTDDVILDPDCPACVSTFGLEP